MSLKRIKEEGLEQRIIEMHVHGKKTHRMIATELKLPESSVYRYLRQYKLENYDDRNLELISRTEDYNPLSLFQMMFDSAAQHAKELAMVSVLSGMIREKVAEKLATGGIDGLLDEDGLKYLALWEKNLTKMTILSQNIGKFVDSYINTFTQVLDIQKEVSYVRVVTEVLKKKSPEDYKVIQRALNDDPAARAVLNALKPADITSYWAENEAMLPARAKKVIENGDS